MSPEPALSTELQDPTLALRWLGRARLGTLVAQLGLMILAEAGSQIHLHRPELVALLGVWGGVDLALRFTGDRGASWMRVRLAAAVDLAALTGILALSGGPHNPLSLLYLSYLAVYAMALRPREAWVATGAAIVLQAGVVLFPVPVSGIAVDDPFSPHTLSHLFTFDVSAAAITLVVTRLAAALRDRDAESRRIAERRAVVERLAALGTLGAGVAHELATPLGTIQLLAEEVAREAATGRPTAEALRQLGLQVDRCRQLLDRLRGRDMHPGEDCVPDVEAWVAEWCRGAPGIRVSTTPYGAGAVLGGAEGWRGALWVALDNARNAAATDLRVTVEADTHVVTVLVDDDGRGPDAEALAHAGEPFWTGSQGAGLGLFVSRSFAQAVGGDVRLEARPGGGGRTRITLPRRPE